MADRPSSADPPACPSAGCGGSLPPELRTWMQVLAASGSVEQQLRKHVKEALGVSHDEFLVLCLLVDQPGNTLRMTRIAELLGRPKTRLTYQVACLQHAGLVTRETVSGDRRGVALVLTEKARSLFAQKAPELARTFAEAFVRTIGPAEREAIVRLLARADPPGADVGV
uniref:MarR family winged helix-turn-helix transcriptional regulator n=1 Tax=Streptomyces sp. NBC_01401 TaxID=2903854 RepID=A0AAU3H363_9ACTN